MPYRKATRVEDPEKQRAKLELERRIEATRSARRAEEAKLAGDQSLAAERRRMRRSCSSKIRIILWHAMSPVPTMLLAAGLASKAWPLSLMTVGLWILIDVAMVWGYFTGPRRELSWVAELPFPMRGYLEVLGGPAAVTEVSLQIKFAEAKDLPDPASIVDLVSHVSKNTKRYSLRTYGGRTTPEVSADGCSLRLTSGHEGAEATNRPLKLWVRRLTKDVLIPLHRAYDIEDVDVRAEATAKFNERYDTA